MTTLSEFNEALSDLQTTVETSVANADARHARLMEGLDALESALECVAILASALAELQAMRGGK